MARSLYHTYKDPYPATLTHPYCAPPIERPSDWPKSYRTRPNKIFHQGIHPAAPVYDYTPGAYPQYPNWQNMWAQVSTYFTSMEISHIFMQI